MDILLTQMKRHRWFAGLGASLQGELLANSRVQRLGVGEFLSRQGDETGCFYGLVHGTLKVSTLREDGREAILTLFEAGNWFGETSLLDGLPRIHDVSALTAAEVLCVDPPVFERLMGDAAFARAVALLQAIHTRLVYTMLEDVMLRSTRVRIARRLEHLAHGDATLASHERQVLNVTQDELAMMLGITRQTLALELKAMAAEGIVVLKYGKVEIASLNALKAVEASR